jgi:tetratricopeptide (TPR) repeat protein
MLCGIYLGILTYQKKQLLILGLGILPLGLLTGFIVLYPPLHPLFFQIQQQTLAHLWINYLVAWKMAQNYLTGAGPGGVTFLFQSFRPHWAGLTLPFQTEVDSLPGHLLAELGIIGIIAWLGLLGWFILCGFRWLRRLSRIPYTDQVLSLALLAGLFVNGIVSFGAFQLNTIAISGSLLITVATLAAQFRSYHDEHEKKARAQWRIRRSKILWGIGGGLVIAACLWQMPMVQAQALVYPDTNPVSLKQRLEQAANQVPWDPVYPYHLTWILGNDLFLHPEQATKILPETLKWMERATALTPYWEVAQTNLAWLYFRASPLDPRVTARFSAAARLLPAQPWVFYGLGLSLLAQGRLHQATVAFSLEIVRHPATITSPLWQDPSVRPLYPRILNQLEDTYTQLLTQASPAMALYLHQVRGSIRWWSGNLTGAKEDWDRIPFTLGQGILTLDTSQTFLEDIPQELPSKWLMAAWIDPSNRISSLEKAWIQANLSPPTKETLHTMAQRMNEARSFDHWIKTLAPTQTYRPQRSYLSQGLVGLGEAVRFEDFFEVSENVIIRDLCSDLFPETVYFRELDQILEPLHRQLIDSLQPDPIPLGEG